MSGIMSIRRVSRQTGPAALSRGNQPNPARPESLVRVFGVTGVITATKNPQKTPSLFAAEERASEDNRPAPAAVIKELVDVHGMNPRQARKLPYRVAFARLWAFRRKSMAFGASERRAAALDVLARLRKALDDEYTTAATLSDLCAEAVAILDSPDVTRVAAGLANLLAELAA